MRFGFLLIQVFLFFSVYFYFPGMGASVHARSVSTAVYLFDGSQTPQPASSGRIDPGKYTLNSDSLYRLRADEAVSVIVPVSGEEIVFFRSSATSREKASTWIGKDKTGDYSLLMTLGRDHLFARIVHGKSVYTIIPTRVPNVVISYRRDPHYEVDLVDDTLPAPEPLPGTVAGPATQADDGTRLDMMIAYTTGMAAAYPGAQIDTRLQYLTDLANFSFLNSGIDTRFNLVHSREYAYPDDSPGDMEQALNDLSANIGVFSDVEALRAQYGADQVTLLRQFVDEGCGFAWLLTRENARSAYAVVHDGRRTDGSGYYCSEFSYVHEVGHNLGCAHDRENASVDGRFLFSYGYQDPGQEFRTVMAYNCPENCIRVAYFSNPSVLYKGKPTGVADTDPLSADNARTINRTRVGMAGYQPQGGVSPVINPPPPLSPSLSLPAILFMLDKP